VLMQMPWGAANCNRQEKTGGTGRGGGEASEISRGKRVKAPVDSIPKAHTWLPDGALASGGRDCGRERAGGMYTAVAQDVKMEILVMFSHFDCDGRSLRV
jgi:hypothetical protein